RRRIGRRLVAAQVAAAALREGQWPGTPIETPAGAGLALRWHASALRRVAARPVRLVVLDRRALLDPFGKTAVDVRDVGHAHVLERLGGQGAAPAGAAKQHE